MEKKILLGLGPDELQKVVSAAGGKPFTARQLAEWLYVHRVADIDDMTSLSKRMRGSLSESYETGRMGFTRVQTSVDGTRKYLFPTLAGGAVESAYIPDGDRATLCVSSQEGCRMGCRFCMTGRGGFTRSLTAGEIVNQIFSIEESSRLTNIVFMGMGEPLDNTEEVIKAINVITSPWGMAWSPTRVTLSTIGVMGSIPAFMERTSVHLAVSLHSPESSVRGTLMPVERRYPIEEVVRMLRGYDFRHQRRISFEYTLFDGVNDRKCDADRLAGLIAGMGARVNLIRFHRIPDSDLAPSSEETIARFKSYLERHGIITTVRASRGEDIFAACGMLSTADKKGVPVGKE
ncbi:MAG: 23S rRNA (adenine(2503)-C(2))-methyltransferase RlmN [Rikenellaceae bacterium]|nr:23S rRNA (adenine(2503)-C(2))-methyltransferase RlmN [Rikenellaceae bacterium]